LEASGGGGCVCVQEKDQKIFLTSIHSCQKQWCNSLNTFPVTTLFRSLSQPPAPLPSPPYIHVLDWNPVVGRSVAVLVGVEKSFGIFFSALNDSFCGCRIRELSRQFGTVFWDSKTTVFVLAERANASTKFYF
jgi:hypothetical protein